MGQPPTFTKKRRPTTKPTVDFTAIEGKNVNIVFVGDTCVDKKTYVLNVMGIPPEEQETAKLALVTLVPHKKICGANCRLYITDGAPESDRLRPLAYPQKDLFVLMYSSESKSSLNNIRTKWNKEINIHAAGTYKVILGIGPNSNGDTKDGDNTNDGGRVSVEDAKSLAKEFDGILGVFFAKVDDQNEAKVSMKDILGHYGGILKTKVKMDAVNGCKKK
mmetsp:Transcript_8016/g.11017  ORF Transcript_8016/g.11017 Transcript_8016/m.11017 type:complete len:219 (+) Transcript_8016:86-742(+)|eukprot:CAMPEP_0185251710 /NCGR_PEP_ID=MMETSP1359-20130426/1051_1 /TAXON_ID=552665 /ORGANISM="Bigelowiella longifila, Strain CCMP242" /LENGTH=218 /DNA_ID=CAMNT_0027833711 /DNA_START=85 /DNA_END=741 /DNA_ORIENTATION=+